jgi:hypothetical protein
VRLLVIHIRPVWWADVDIQDFWDDSIVVSRHFVAVGVML